MEPLKENKIYAASHHSFLRLLMEDSVITGFRLKLCTIDRKKKLHFNNQTFLKISDINSARMHHNSTTYADVISAFS